MQEMLEQGADKFADKVAKMALAGNIGALRMCLDRLVPARATEPFFCRRFWEHLIRDDEDYRRHVEYCYINPVKHGLVTRVRDWPFSSFHRDVAAGLFPQDWAGDFDTLGEFGEARVAQ
jgi:hypothetical protein